MRRLVRIVLVAVTTAAIGVAALLFGGQIMVRATLDVSCEGWRSRPIDELEVSVDELLETVSTTPTYTVPVPGRWTGMSLPGATLHQDNSSGLVLVHEAAHQVQMRRDGLVAYSWRYAHEWLSGVYAGCSFYSSYRSVSYEYQARASVDTLPRAVRALVHEVDDPEDLQGLEAAVVHETPRNVRTTTSR